MPRSPPRSERAALEGARLHRTRSQLTELVCRTRWRVSIRAWPRRAGPSGRLAGCPKQRLGIFTLPAVIASHSGPTTTRLVKRGVFFVRKVMCMPLGAAAARRRHDHSDRPPAPPNGRGSRPSPPRARCAGCHAFINPFGFMQENFDAIGRLRTTDNGQPIDAEHPGRLPRRGASSPPARRSRRCEVSPTRWRFQQCFASQLFRFYTGRDETAGDDPVLRQMFFDFADDDRRGHRQPCCIPWPAPRPLPAIGGAMMRRHEQAHPSRPDQVLRASGVLADAGRQGDGLRAGGSVRRSAAVRAVLQGAFVPLADHQPTTSLDSLPAPLAAAVASRRRTSSCSRA